MEEMKSCPFCGGEDVEIVTDMFEENYVVTCKSCPAQISDKTLEQAVKSWNTREK